MPPLACKNSQLSQNTLKNQPKQFKHIPADVRAEKIAQGVCSYYDQKYDKNHSRKFGEIQLFRVEICRENSEQEFATDIEWEEQGVKEVLETTICISVNALNGNQSLNTIRVLGRINGQPLHILIVTRSTHNFLDFIC